MKETDFQRTVIDLAHHMGWHVAHFRTAMTRKTKEGKPVWVTPVQADGKGFPDLVLVRDRVVFVELKAEKGRLSPEQAEWRDWLIGAGQEWYCWKPSDWPSLQERLRGME